MRCLSQTEHCILFKRNNTPFTNSVVSNELISKIRITLKPFVTDSRRISLEDESSTIRGIVVSANHEHCALSMELLCKIQMTSTERGSLLKNSLDIVVQQLFSPSTTYTSKCSTSGSQRPARNYESLQEPWKQYEQQCSQYPRNNDEGSYLSTIHSYEKMR